MQTKARSRISSSCCPGALKNHTSAKPGYARSRVSPPQEGTGKPGLRCLLCNFPNDRVNLDPQLGTACWYYWAGSSEAQGAPPPRAAAQASRLLIVQGRSSP
ncbi:scale keratin-like [Platysternon megacephalum]|uniref:Scale keratin-like n=1 Tax=Platysternon megacephalum TaxID=55544 RepID=A0A4D9DKR8_9SAUR|nr:scale keratin-like [Platysternon megacephalum]